MPEIIRNCKNCDLLGEDGEDDYSYSICKLTYCQVENENEDINRAFHLKPNKLAMFLDSGSM